jgi:hypothetical protein
VGDSFFLQPSLPQRFFAFAASAANEADAVAAPSVGISGITRVGLAFRIGEVAPKEEKEWAFEDILEMEKERDLKANGIHPF